MNIFSLTGKQKRETYSEHDRTSLCNRIHNKKGGNVVKMAQVNVNEMIETAKFNKFHGILLFWSAIIMLFDGFDLSVYGAVVPVIMEEWQISPVETGMIGSYALIGMTLGALIFGTIADKLGRKKIILICVFLFSLFMVLAAFAPNAQLFGLCRFIQGLGLGGMMPNVIALVSDYSPRGTRSRMIASIMAGYSIGGILAATLSIVLIPKFGWESVYIFGGLPILFIPFLIRQLPDSMEAHFARKEYGHIKEILMKVQPSYQPGENEQFILNRVKKSSSSVASLFAKPRTVTTFMFWITYFMSLLMIYGLSTWLPKFMSTAGFPLGSSLGFLLVLNAGATVGAFFMGWLADLWGVTKSLMMFYLVAAVMIFGLGLSQNIILLYLIVAVAGAVTIGTQHLTNSYVSQYYPASIRSTGLGWALGIGRIGGILGPAIGGFLMAANLSLQFNFLAFALPGIIAAIAVSFTNRHPEETAVAKDKATTAL